MSRRSVSEGVYYPPSACRTYSARRRGAPIKLHLLALTDMKLGEDPYAQLIRFLGSAAMRRAVGARMPWLRPVWLCSGVGMDAIQALWLQYCDHVLDPHAILPS